MKIQFYINKLLVNLGMLATEVALILVAYNAFTQKLAPLVGALSVIGLLGLLWTLVRVSRRRRFRYQRPGMLKTTLVVIAVVTIFAFTGVQPMASYKDKVTSKVTGALTERQTQSEERATHKRILEEERASKLGVSNPSQVAEEIKNNRELRIGLEVIELVNGLREERGTPELAWDDTLYEYSLAHSKNMARVKRLFHSRIGLSYAENAWGGEGSQSWGAGTIVNSWMDSPKHRTWLLCPHLKHVAVGVAYSGSGMYASWTFWVSETSYSDWWYQYTPDNPPEWLD